MQTIFTDDAEFVVASSPQEAQARWNGLFGKEDRYDPEQRRWNAIPRTEPYVHTGTPYASDGTTVVKPAGAWADEIGPSFYAQAQ